MKPYYSDEWVTVLCGDALTTLRGLPDESVQCCVTSPPYWGLRDYGTAEWEGGDPECDHKPPYGSGSSKLGGGKATQESAKIYRDRCHKCGATRTDSQLGLEATPEAYVAKMVEVFREVRRVLRADGTLWLNLGDSYAAARSYQVPDGKHCDVGNGMAASVPAGLKPKDLVGIPWRVAFALQQPYYTGRIKDERMRYWLAGLVDGEGCMTVLRTTSPHGSGESYPPVLQVRMCDDGPIHRCAEITGLGTASPRQDPPSQGGQRGSYQWRLSARNAADVAGEIYPYLLVKRKQALLVWNQQLVRESYQTKRGVTIPTDALEKQKEIRRLIRALNASEPVDLPSWLKEPPPQYEPGWYLRSDCIWAKPNPMPESVTDRPTKAHEYLFLLSKSERYYYDADAIAEPSVGTWNSAKSTLAANGIKNVHLYETGQRRTAGADTFHRDEDRTGRNRRTVWTITTKPYPDAHFATFPPELPRLCIKAGSKKGGTVMDPFAGAGTTVWQAKELNRKGIAIELNPEYCGLIAQRCSQGVLALNTDGEV